MSDASRSIVVIAETETEDARQALVDRIRAEHPAMAGLVEIISPREATRRGLDNNIGVPVLRPTERDHIMRLSSRREVPNFLQMARVAIGNTGPHNILSSYNDRPYVRTSVDISAEQLQALKAERLRRKALNFAKRQPKE